MIAVLFAALLAGEVPAAANASSPVPTLQSQFDGASAAYHAGSFEDAIRQFEALEQNPRVQKNPLVLSTVLMRKGASLLDMGRVDQAEIALRQGLKAAPSDRAEIRADRYLSEQGLGLIGMERLDYAAAAAHFANSLALADESSSKVSALIMLARATTFDPGNDAVRYAELALAEVGTPNPKDDKARKQIADLRTIHARALLNQGRFPEALDVLEKAVKEQGGLDLRVDVGEIITRSDLAIAAMLSRLPDTARKYLAYTGAGRIQDAPFHHAMSMEPPPCGGTFALKPEDVAVVEFGIDADGSVRGVRPVYASVRGGAVFEFARAVSGWSWRSVDVAKIPALFRAVTRVELRCTTTTERPAIHMLLMASIADWLTSSQVGILPKGANEPATVQLLQGELARREVAGDGLAPIPVLLALAASPVTTIAERATWLTDARNRAIQISAPTRIVIGIEVLLAEARRSAWSRSSAEEYRAHLRSLLARPGSSSDPVIAGTLSLMIAERLYKLPPPPDAIELLKAVAIDERLPAHHQLRVGALVRLAALQAAAGDISAAAESYRKTGLAAQQCALLDSPPAVIRSGVSGSDYPMEALRMGFEGWVRTEFDIMADGRTNAQRVIVAYPPLVFRDAGVGIARRMIYAKSYRPDGSAGCSGATQNIKFQIP